MRSTDPLVASGTRVDGLEFRFEGGKIVEVDASSGADIIRAQLATDEQAPASASSHSSTARRP